MIWAGTYEAKGGAGLQPLADLGGAPQLRDGVREIANASFAAWSPDGAVAYFVDEQEEGQVGAWRRTDDGWSPLGSLGSGGAAPCYLSISPDGTRMAVANYGDGSLGLIALDPGTGALIRPLGHFRPAGTGKDPERQEGPHAHCAIFAEEGRAVYHVDLGLDTVFRHDLDGNGLTGTQVAFQAPAGYGPRHLAFHPDGEHALLVCELAARLLLLRREGTLLRCVQDVPTAPEPVSGENLGGHLAIDEEGIVRVTNRGHDSLVSFALEGGRLAMRGWCHTGGSSPRHFIVDAGTAFIAHEEGECVTRVDLASGRVTARLPVPGAAFLFASPTGERRGAA